MALGTREIRSHKDLVVWQKLIDMVSEIYRLTKSYPEDQKFGLVSQMQRASVSIPANIAEGYGRHATKEYSYFLRIALGSLAELDALITISRKLSYLPVEECSKLEAQLGTIGKMFYALHKRIH